jgi:hypothetical protein
MAEAGFDATIPLTPNTRDISRRKAIIALDQRFVANRGTIP